MVQSGQLVYQKQREGGQTHPSPEFMVRVDMDVYHKCRKSTPMLCANANIIDDVTACVAELCETKEVLFNRTGSKSGIFEHPTGEALMDAFGTKDFDTVVHFMLKHGECRTLSKHEDAQGKDQGIFHSK